MAGTLVASLWLELYRAQRPLSYAELSSAVPDLSHGQKGPVLNMAYRQGYVERKGAHRRYLYCVTPRCTVPPGVAVVEILEAFA